jgi:hypothetical protein
MKQLINFLPRFITREEDNFKLSNETTKLENLNLINDFITEAFIFTNTRTTTF